MRLDGTDFQQLTDNEWYESFRGLSGDGEWMVYSGSLNDEFRLYRMRLDGTSQKIIGDLSWPEQVFWSPDRTWLVYREMENQGNLANLRSYDVAMDQSHALNFRSFLTWSRDSEWLYFPTDENGKNMLGRLRRNGSEREILQEVSEYFRFLAWSPIIDLDWSRALMATIAFLGILFVAILSILPCRFVQAATILGSFKRLWKIGLL